ncbi:uncharacterized protein N7515_003115 [Penicillium bovifimosum]|uniref:HTH APSES-type domain-containing protein n=1 Tax=Penicillium bovifimosum TaxID=126998 RepID=A0A9W9L5X3_9EURO|nr:uncharacterized protein N7515_003115 [Penicillium bovifimosum]KAJ5138267.1 hypothetical protein N7515_003115 [Penicillium bovifimosum]
MLSINSLLNPQPERRAYTQPPVSISREKRQKMAKDAPVFRPGETQGKVRYRPHLARDPELERLHREFSIHPMGAIDKYPREIPYASDKKTFQEKTGRESFHVFQYTFRIPGEEKEWTVMWDYNIGIVRITHLFKCNGNKLSNLLQTTPGKMLNQNPSLREICHSITGGALSAQGYWMPYECAKALAATFCWRIRYALTPLFGNDFPAMCIPPTDRIKYNRMVIDKNIIARATELAKHYRSLEPSHSGQFSRPAPRVPSSTYRLLQPNREDPSLKLAPLKIPHHQYAESSASARDSSTEPYCMSPKSASPFSAFTPVNPSRKTVPTPRSHVESSQSNLHQMPEAMGPEDISGESDTDSISSSNLYSTPHSTSADDQLDAEKATETDGPVEPSSDDGDLTDSDDDWQVDDAEDKDYRGPPLKKPLHGSPRLGRSASPRSQGKKNPDRISRPARSRPVPHFIREVNAAEALLRLHMVELEEMSTETEVEDDGAATPLSTLSLGAAAPRTRKRRRASL